MYKNLQYPQSLWVHRQSAITGSTVSAASQQVCPAVVASLKLPYWDFSADCCFIVKLAGTLCCLLYPVLFCSGKIVLKCHDNRQHLQSSWCLSGGVEAFYTRLTNLPFQCGCWSGLACTHLEIVNVFSSLYMKISHPLYIFIFRNSTHPSSSVVQ